MKKQINLEDLDARLSKLDEESHWNEEHSSQLKNRIFNDIKKNNSTILNKRTPYTYYGSLSVVGFLLWILVSPYMSQYFTGFTFYSELTTGSNLNIFRSMPLQIVFSVALLILFMAILNRKSTKLNHLFRKTQSLGMTSPFMRKLFGKVFRVLVSIFTFYLLLKGLIYIDFIYERNNLYKLMFIVLVVLSFWIGKKLFERFVNLRWHYPLQIIGSLLILFFFSFQMFTPYFFEDEHLINEGQKKIEMYYQIGNQQLSFNERSEIIERTFTKTWNNVYLDRLSSEFAEIQLQNIEVTSISRRFNDYELVVEVELYLMDQQPNYERSTWAFTFTREDGQFKIAGFHSK
jgi:hypothetical protein